MPCGSVAAQDSTPWISTPRCTCPASPSPTDRTTRGRSAPARSRGVTDACRPLTAEMPDRDRPGAPRTTAYSTDHDQGRQHPMTVDSFVIPGLDEGTALRFVPGPGGTLTMAVTGPGAGPDASVSLARSWLPALAAWFAGEAVVPGTRHEDGGQLMLCVVSDGAAVVWSACTWARLRCTGPSGPVTLRVCPLGRPYGPEVRLAPDARQDAAAWLVRTGAPGRARAA